MNCKEPLFSGFLSFTLLFLNFAQLRLLHLMLFSLNCLLFQPATRPATNSSPPAQYFAAPPVHDCYQVKVPPQHWQISNISTPNLIRFLYSHPLEQVRIASDIIRWQTGLGSRIDRLNPHHSHQPSHSFMVKHLPLSRQPCRHPPDAIKRGRCVLSVNEVHANSNLKCTIT